MKHYKDFLVHGAQLFRHLKGQQASGSEKSLEKLPLAAARTAARALARNALGEDGGGSDFGLGLGGDNADMGAFMESFDQCGIDVDEMTNKALGAYFLYGSNVDLSSPETYPGIDAFGPIFLSLKDDDEMDCSDQEIAELTAAFEGYAQCSGISNFVDPEEIKSGVLLQSVQDACKPVFDMVTSPMLSLYLEAGIIYDENSDLYASGKKCLRTLLGDNSIGNFIRYEYDHMDKILQCFTKLSEDLPHCVVSAPVEDGESISFPVSLDKKLACVIGSSSDSVIEDTCISIFEMYDECIPHDTNAEEEAVATSCGEDLLPFGMDLSVVTGDKLPSFCSDVFEQKGLDAEALISRFNAYNEKRERGWTIEDYAEDHKDEIDKVENPKDEIETAVEPPDVEAVEDEAPAAEDPKDEIETVAAPPKVEGEVKAPVQPEDMYKSNPIDVASVESGNWEDGEAEPSVTKAKSFPFLAAGIAILAAVMLALFVKYRSYGAATSTQRPRGVASALRKDYSSDLILQVEEPIV